MSTLVARELTVKMEIQIKNNMKCIVFKLQTNLLNLVSGKTSLEGMGRERPAISSVLFQ